METTNNKGFMDYVNVLIVLALMFLFKFIPAPEPITPYGMAIIGIFAGVIWGWTTSKNGLVWPAIAAVVAIGFTDYGNTSAVLAKIFASDVVMLNIIGMFLMGPIHKADIGEWLVTKLLSVNFIKGHPWRFVAIIIFGTGIMAFLANGFIVSLFMLSILGGLFEKSGYEKGDKFPVMLVIGMFISMLTFSCVFPFRGWALYSISTFSAAVGVGFDFGAWMVVTFLFYIICSLLYIVLMKVMGCDASKMGDADLSEYQEKYKNGLSTYQKVCLGLTLGWVFGCMAVSFLGKMGAVGAILTRLGAVGVTIVVVVSFFVVKVDGKPIITMKEIGEKFMWDMVFVIATGMFIGGIISTEATGVSAFVAKYMGPFLASQPEFLFLLLVACIALVLTNFLNNIAVMMVMMAMLGTMYTQGIITNVYTAGVMVSLSTIIGFYTPAASGYGAMIHSNEWCPPAKVYRYGIFVFLYLFLVLGIMIPVANMVF